MTKSPNSPDPAKSDDPIDVTQGVSGPQRTGDSPSAALGSVGGSEKDLAEHVELLAVESDNSPI